MSKIRLGDIADIQAGPFGTQLHKDEYVDKGIPMLNSKNIGNGSIVTSSLDYVSPSICSRLPNYVLKTGDILFGRAGTIERHAYLPAQYNGCFQGTNCIRIRCYDEKKALFISYFLWTKQVKQTIENSAGGSIQSYITTDLLKSLFVEIPDNYEEIADLLIALDNKIENNYKINDNLAQMLGLIYEQWFYRFEFPNAQNLPYKQANGELEWSEKLKRYIPKGWKVQSMMSNDLFSVISSGVERFTSKKYYATADITGSSIGDGCDVEYETRESRANMQPVLNSVWFAKMKNSVKHLFLNKEMTPFIESSILSTGFYGLKCSEISFEYAASVVSAPIFESTKDRLSHGATQQGIGDDDLANMPLLVPNDTSLSKFHEATKGLYSQISNNILENKRLIAIRNFLLPLLMNGQATIAE